MNKLKKVFFALAVAALVGSLAVPANAVIGQTASTAVGVAFQTTSLPRQVRGEGLTETMGEIVLTVTNLPAATTGTVLDGSSIDLLFLTAITNAPVTANVLCNGAACPASMTAAVVVGTTIFRITFADADAVAGTGTTFSANGDTITVFGIRGNANAAGPAPAIVTITMSGSSATPSTNPITFTDPVRTVGTVVGPSSVPQRAPVAVGSVAVSPAILPTPLAVLTCAPPPVGAANFAVSMTEAFPAALATLIQEGVFTGATLPLPTIGTNVDVVISGVPAGFTVTPTAFTQPAAQVPAVVVTLPAAQVQAAGASGAAMTFTFTVTTATLAAAETITFSFAIGSAAPVAAGGLTGAVTARVRLGPVAALPGAAVRFVEFTQGPATVANIADCVTRLLMSWVVGGFAGFDTGIAFANTSKDDVAFGAGAAVGAVPQSGTCVLTGYPQAGGTEVSFTTPSITAGNTQAFILSGTTGFSGFSGYILTVCNFLNAHAFVFITDGFGSTAGPRVAEGYMANIVPAGTRVIAAGEGLVQ